MKSHPLHIIFHSHWDREWYFPFQVFRARLLYALDRILELAEEFPEFKFHLDGQTVIIEDYLELRPQKREELFSRIREKKILAGPFYILPDEFLISGETAIRNFLIAQNILRSKSIPSMNVAYLPDMFGHSAYIPTLIKGLGMNSVFLWRGVGEKPRDAEFIWKGPDGSRVLAINLVHGYGNLMPVVKENESIKFVENYEKFKKFVEREVETLLKRSNTNHTLLMAGSDHTFPSHLLVKFVRKLKEEGYNCKISTLEEYAEILENLHLELKEIKGELRDSRHVPVLKDALSARISLKQKSHLIERALIKVIEPLMATAYLLGVPIDFDLLHYTWKLFLRTLPHDDICGCSIDQVHREMSVTQDQVLQLIQVMRCQLMNKLTERFKAAESKGYKLVVFSPFPRKTKTIIEKELYLGLDEVHEDLTVVDNEQRLPTEIDDLGVEGCIIRNSESFRLFNTAEEEYIRDFLVSEIPGQHNIKRRRIKVRFEAELPPMSIKIFELRHEKKNNNDKKIIEGNTVETPFLRVSINKDGTLNVEDKRTGRIYKNLCYLEDGEDIGDEYNYSPSKTPEVITTLGRDAKIKVVEGIFGFLVNVEHTLELPECFDFERGKRADKKVSCPVKIFYFIHKNSPRIDIKMNFENKAKDHRLRVCFELPISSKTHIADDYFGPVERPNTIEIEDTEKYVEIPENRYPMQNFVYIADDRGGIVLSTKGLREYETRASQSSVTLALTLLRSVGMLSRAGLITRKGHAGPEIPTPEAQCLGWHTAEFSLYFTESYSIEEAYSFSESYQALPVVVVDKDVEGVEFSVLSIEPSSLILSTFKIAEDKDGVILRLYNVAESEVQGVIKLGWKPKKVETVNMAEAPIERESKIEIKENEITIKAKPHEVITLKLS